MADSPGEVGTVSQCAATIKILSSFVIHFSPGISRRTLLPRGSVAFPCWKESGEAFERRKCTEKYRALELLGLERFHGDGMAHLAHLPPQIGAHGVFVLRALIGVSHKRSRAAEGPAQDERQVLAGHLQRVVLLFVLPETRKEGALTIARRLFAISLQDVGLPLQEVRHVRRHGVGDGVSEIDADWVESVEGQRVRRRERRANLRRGERAFSSSDEAKIKECSFLPV